MDYNPQFEKDSSKVGIALIHRGPVAEAWSSALLWILGQHTLRFFSHQDAFWPRHGRTTIPKRFEFKAPRRLSQKEHLLSVAKI